MAALPAGLLRWTGGRQPLFSVGDAPVRPPSVAEGELALMSSFPERGAGGRTQNDRKMADRKMNKHGIGACRWAPPTAFFCQQFFCHSIGCAQPITR
ncbi:MAG TPA: hypothetical protein VFW87_02930 [Pirellulales bacterium]|nr:hypothetical protein [Pirellulales bacterium]